MIRKYADMQLLIVISIKICFFEKFHRGFYCYTYSKRSVLIMINDTKWLTPEILPCQLTGLTWPPSCLIVLELGHIHDCVWILGVTQSNVSTWSLYVVTPLSSFWDLIPLALQPLIWMQHILSLILTLLWTLSDPSHDWWDHIWSYIPSVIHSAPCSHFGVMNTFTPVCHTTEILGVSPASLGFLHCYVYDIRIYLLSLEF